MRSAVVVHGVCLGVGLGLVVLAVGLGAGNAGGGANGPTTVEGVEGVVVIEGVPAVRQKPNFCGEACVEMWTRKLGKGVTQDQVFHVSGLDPALGRGCYTKELAAAVTKLGFKTGEVWNNSAADKEGEMLERVFGEMVADLRKGVPSIVCMHFDEKPKTTEHFRLVVGWDAGKGEVIYMEPAVKDGGYLRMKKGAFLRLWPLRGGGGMSTAIRIRLEVEKLKDVPVGAGLGDADYCQHVMALKEKMPAGFTVVVQKPFVVVGDERAEVVKGRAESTVKWAVEKLKADYFAKDPEEILDVWLFKDKKSYDRYTKEIFDDEPGTPYGYYSAEHRALIMNISTGGGTLVHEIVHPFMRANFPECPPWFNEGMGSLYEQSAEREGHIVGLTNWRLEGLQRAIKAGTVPSFEALCKMDVAGFYTQDRGTNYAQARYLCYYLQEKGLLVKYYQAFTAGKKEDPTGYKSLQKVLGEEDMGAFKGRWEKWVTGLRFP